MENSKKTVQNSREQNTITKLDNKIQITVPSDSFVYESGILNNNLTIRVKWRIDKFSCFESGMYGSSMFSSNLPEFKDKWSIEMNTKLQTNGGIDHLAIYLKLNSVEKNTNLPTQCSFSILNCNNQDAGSKRFDHIFSQENNLRGIDEFMPLHDLKTSQNKYLLNDELTIICEIVIPVNKPDQKLFCNIITQQQNSASTPNIPTFLQNKKISPIMIKLPFSVLNLDRLPAVVSDKIKAMNALSDNQESQDINMESSDPVINMETSDPVISSSDEQGSPTSIEHENSNNNSNDNHSNSSSHEEDGSTNSNDNHNNSSSNEEDDSTNPNDYKYNYNAGYKLADGLAQLFMSQQSSDLMIHHTNKSYSVIQGILASRSSFFAELFRSQCFKKKGMNEITLYDNTEVIFEEVLNYIYTDKVRNLECMALDLLVAAAKYKLPGLKKMAEQEIINGGITVDSAPTLLEFAYTHKAEKLKKISMDVIINNMTEIIHHESFEKLKSNDEIFMKLLEVMATKMDELKKIYKKLSSS